jgi:hypothetical protein
MCKITLWNRPELNKVYHSFYNLFSGRIQGVKIGGVSKNTLSNIIYRIESTPRIEELQKLKKSQEALSGSM